MVTSFRLIAGLVGASPILIFWDSPLSRGLLAAYVAAVVICIVLSVRPGERAHLATVFKPVAIAASISAAWMLIQVLPLPIPGLLHPIWLSARDALNDTALGSISIDPGATLVALSRYLTMVGIVFAAAAVTIDRQWAEWVLVLLAGVATFVAAALALHDLGGRFFWGEIVGAGPRASMEAISALGVIITAAAGIRAFERFETRRSTAQMSFLKFSRTFIYWVLALAICWSVVFFLAPPSVAFAATCGVGILAWVLVVRRLGLAVWSRSLVAAAAVAVAVFVVLSHSAPANTNLTLRFVSSASVPLVSTAQRILAEATWSGSGAGTFAALIPIYRTGNVVFSNGVAPTTAANVAVELGAPALYVSLLIGVFLIAVLLRGALQRGRDSFYATAAAGCAVVASVQAYCDSSLTNAAVSTIAAVVVGLGIAQSVSRNLQQPVGFVPP